MRSKVVPASAWEDALQNRAKARDALKRVEELRKLNAKRDRLLHELEQQLYDRGFDHDDLYLHAGGETQGISMSPQARAALNDGRCFVCGTKFYRGQSVREFLDDDGRVVARLHVGCR